MDAKQMALPEIRQSAAVRFSPQEAEDAARGQVTLGIMNRALLRINLRHMTLEEVVAEWHIANGQKEENA